MIIFVVLRKKSKFFCMIQPCLMSPALLGTILSLSLCSYPPKVLSYKKCCLKLCLSCPLTVGYHFSANTMAVSELPNSSSGLRLILYFYGRTFYHPPRQVRSPLYKLIILEKPVQPKSSLLDVNSVRAGAMSLSLTITDTR